MTERRNDSWHTDTTELAEFFNDCAHGTADHRLWLLEKIESFWDTKIPRDLVAEGLKEPEGRNAI